MVRHALAVLAIAAFASPAYGQGLLRDGRHGGALGPAAAPRTTFQQPAEPPAAVTPAQGGRAPRHAVRPGPRDSAPPVAPHAAGDLFLAHRGTYAPRFAPHHGRYPYAPAFFPPFHGYVPAGPVAVQDHEAPAGVEAGWGGSEHDGAVRAAAAGAGAPGYLRLDVQPEDARVFVNGALAGTVSDLTGSLPLPAGLHRIALEADGFEGVAFDVRVHPNERVRYAGRLALVTANDESLRPAAAAAKTLYVIPRCYAGDRVPRQADLPADCRLDDMRVIAPGR